MFSNQKTNQTNPHFRTWKSGKRWLFAASILATLVGSAFISHPKVEASTVQITYTAKSGDPIYPTLSAWVWGTGTSSDNSWTTLKNVAGTENYTATISGVSSSGAGMTLVKTQGDWSTQIKDATGGTNINLSATETQSELIHITGDNVVTSDEKFTIPTIKVPTISNATVDTPLDLTATVSNPDQLPSLEGLKVEVNGVLINDPAHFIPTNPGAMTVSYRYEYTLPNKTTDTATQSISFQVAKSDQGILSVPANQTLSILAGKTTQTFHPTALKDSLGNETTVQLLDAGNQVITPKADGSYELTSGTYRVVYTGKNTAPERVTQTITVNQAPATITVHYYNPNGYEGWNMWKWVDDNNGAGNTAPASSPTFSGTQTAQDGTVWDTAQLIYDTSGTAGNATAPFNSVSLIIRQSINGNDWANQTQNLVFAPNEDGSLKDIYVVSGDNTHIYSTEQEAMAAYKKAQEIVTMDWKAFDAHYAYEGTLGSFYSKASTTFKVWAPTTDVTGVTKVQLIDYGISTLTDKDLDLRPARVIEMTQGTTQSTDLSKNTIGLWTTVVSGDMKNHVYTYRVTYADGSVKETQDPYSTAVIVNGHRSVVIEPNETIPEHFKVVQGAQATWRVSDPTKAIIQEMNVRDFTISKTSGVASNQKGKYLGVIQSGTKNSAGASTGLDYLKKLGVNYVQIMPAADFASVDETGAGQQQNWGYDPENYNVPEGSFSTDAANPVTRITEFKTMVQGLHDAGLGVIMDVVYPHQANQSLSPFQIMAPNYYFRLSNGSGCGNDTASEREMYSNYIVNSVLYWVNTYDVDGFRFDQMMQIDTGTMNKIREKLSQIDPNIILYGEGWNGGTTALPENEKSNQDNIQKIPGVGVFNDIARDAIKGSDVYSQTDPKTGFVNGQTGNSVFTDTEAAVANVITGTHTSSEDKKISALTPSQIMNFIEVHDNATLNDLIWKENPKDDQATHDARVNLANAINLLAQGVPVIETGQEFDRTKVVDSNGNGVIDQDEFNAAANSYNTGDTANEINWDLLSAHADMVDFIQSVIAFRKAHPSFQLTSYNAISQHVKITNAAAGSGVITYEVTENGIKYLVIYNATDKAIHLGKSGTYYTATDFSDALVEISDSSNLSVGQTLHTATVSVNALSATILRLTPEKAPVLTPPNSSVLTKNPVRHTALKKGQVNPSVSAVTLKNEGQGVKALPLQEKILPKTGSEDQSALSVFGVAILSLLGVTLGLKKRQE